jgi:ectoine hydroxylase-related dioxygenase (phytanoyl-CoA dioxygenase family)
MLSAEQKADFAKNGVLVIRQFYDTAREIAPIQRAIYEIIGLVALRHGLTIARAPFDGSNFDEGYAELIAIDRQYGGEIYDLVKQIPTFLRLISSERSEQLFCELRETELAGIGVASYGIRIDNPHEEQYRSHWHQEFMYQPQSMDGVVMWTPLLEVQPDMGPVIVCLGSNRDGLCTYGRTKDYAQKSGAYKVGIVDAENVAARYEQVAPLTRPGDLIIMDYLTLHQSGFNVSGRARWSIQSRFFNFRESTGMRIGWKPSVTAGTDIEAIFPDNFIETDE